MLATQIISRTRKILQIELPLRRFFEVPTIAEQASAISEIETGNRLALLATELAELHELEQLSEAEAKRLLEEELRAGSVQ
jgi:hypothetical protein